MAGNPTFAVLDAYQVWLSTQMPAQLQGPPSSTVPVYYSAPGDRAPGAAAVWFGDVSDSYEVHSLRAAVRRRLVTVEFDLVIGVWLTGATVDGTLQRQCDEFAHSIRQIIDLDIADEEHLHSPALVDWAKVVESRTERGMTVDGVGARITMRVAFQTRFID